MIEPAYAVEAKEAMRLESMLRALLWVIGTCAGLFLLLLVGGLSMPSLNERVAKARIAGLRSVELYASEEADVRRGLAAYLKDPTSAQYGPIHAYFDDQERVIICGTVNARNSFGGYVGDVSYFGLLKNDTFLPGVIDTATSSLAENLCRDNEIKKNDALISRSDALIAKVKNEVKPSQSAGWDTVVSKK